MENWWGELLGSVGFEVEGLFSRAECMWKWMESGGTKGSDIKAKKGEEEKDLSLDSRRKLYQNGESQRRRGWELKKEREWGKSSGPEKVLCVGRERKKNKRGKKIGKKSEGDRGFKRFSGCRGSSFLFMLLKRKALISGSGTLTFATPVTSFLPRHLQRMHR